MEWAWVDDDNQLVTAHWVGEPGVDDVEIPQEVTDAGVGFAFHVWRKKRRKQGALVEYYGAKPGVPAGFQVHDSGALLVSIDGSVRRVYNANEWTEVKVDGVQAD